MLAILACLLVFLIALAAGWLRGRVIASTLVLLGIVAALTAQSLGHDPFLVAAAWLVPALLGVVLQNMKDTFVLLAQSRRRSRRRRRPQRQAQRLDRSRERSRLAA